MSRPPDAASDRQGTAGRVIVVIGFPKAGTTAWYDLLTSHPHVWSSPTKEWQYFYPLLSRVVSDRDTAGYLARIGRIPDGQVGVDASPDYVFGERVADQFTDVAGSTANLRLLCVLRDPVERAWSHVRFHESLGAIPRGTSLAHLRGLVGRRETYTPPPNPSFALSASAYDRYLSIWTRRFTRAQLRVIADPQRVAGPALRQVLAWLQLPEDELPATRRGPQPGSVPRSNVTVMPRSQGLASSARTVSEYMKRSRLWPEGTRRATRTIYARVNGAAAPTLDADTRARVRADLAGAYEAAAAAWASHGLGPRPDWLDAP